MINLEIDEEFESLLRPLSEEEFTELENNILADGRVRDPLIVWCGLIIDGHNRWKVIQKHPEIPFTTEEKHFEYRDDAIEWIIRNQIGRRNLTPFERAELALRLKPELAKAAKERQGSHHFGKDAVETELSQPHEEYGRTKDKLAAIANVSSNTITKTDKILSKGSPEQISQVRSGARSMDAVYNEILDSERQPKHPKQKSEYSENRALIKQIRQNSEEMASEQAYEYTLDDAITELKNLQSDYVSKVLRVLDVRRDVISGSESVVSLFDVFSDEIKKLKEEVK